MYIRLSDISLLVTDDGEIIDSVRDWVLMLRDHKNFSSTTIDRYVSALNLFYEYQSVRGPKQLNSEKEINYFLYKFLNDLQKGDETLGWQPHSASSVLVVQNALSSYLAYTLEDDYMKEECVLNRFALAYRKTSMLGYLTPSLRFHKGKKRNSRRQPHWLRRQKEVIKFFPPELFWDFIDILKSHRDKAFFLLCAGTSARIGQALNVWCRDIMFDKKRVSFIDPRTPDRNRELEEKYGKSHSLINNKGLLPGVWLPGPFNDEFFMEAMLYYEREFIPISKRLNAHPYFFVTRTGNRLLPQNVDVTFGHTAAKLGMTDLSPHSLRHLFGYICAAHLGFESEQIADWMGHANIESTRVYTKIPSGETEILFKEKLQALMKRNIAGQNDRGSGALKFLTKGGDSR